MQAEYFLDSAHEETHGCDYLLANDIDMEPVPGYAAANWEKGYGDFVMKPDMATLRRIPWLPGSALVLCDILDHHDHEDVPHAPRGMLKKQIARLSAQKMSAFFASELEFYLFDETYETAADKKYDALKTAGRYIEDYHILQTTKEEGVMRAIRVGLQGAGIPVENSKGEWGPGQEEINVRYANALHDGRQSRHPEKRSQGNRAAAGQGGHLHVEMALRPGRLVKPHPFFAVDAAGKKPLFQDDKADHGMSKLMQHYVAGQLAYAREITWFLRPTSTRTSVSKRARSRRPRRSGRKTIATAGFRLCGAHSKGIRIECRVGGADLNPYLAYAALLAAGLGRHRAETRTRGPLPRATPTRASACAKCRRRSAKPRR